MLSGVDKLEPVSGGGDLDHAEKAFGELIISRGDGAIDFQATEEAFDEIACICSPPWLFSTFGHEAGGMVRGSFGRSLFACMSELMLIQNPHERRGTSQASC